MLDKIVYELNESFLDFSFDGDFDGDCLSPFIYRTNGIQAFIEFCGYRVYASEDYPDGCPLSVGCSIIPEIPCPENCEKKKATIKLLCLKKAKELIDILIKWKEDL